MAGYATNTQNDQRMEHNLPQVIISKHIYVHKFICL